MITLAVSFTSLSETRVTDLSHRADGAIGEAISRGLDEVAATARANVVALRDPGRPSSSPLVESIQSESDVDGLSGAVRAGGETAPYAGFVEFGTIRSPAQPFLMPALTAHEERIRGGIAEALDSALGGRP